MAFFITTLAHALVPLALAVALLPAAGERRRGGGAARDRTGALVLGLFAGLAGGALLAAVAATRAAETTVGTSLRSIALGLAVVTIPALLGRLALPRRDLPVRLLAVVAPLLVAGFAAQGAFDAWDKSAPHSLTATGVVNTELIVNAAAIALGVALLALLAVITRRVAGLAGGRAAAAVLVAVLMVEAVTGSAQVMLGLLRLDQIAVTGGRVSFVARVSLAEAWAVHAELGLALGLALVAWRRRFRVAPTPRDGSRPARVRHRRERATALGQSRWRRGLAGVAVFLLAVLLYQDLYATLPPALSPAAPVQPDAAGTVRIPIDGVKDGALHRYAYVASDGHRVRFFLINRYDPEHVRMGVVYDACMICGDDGYIQRGEEIICIACNVRIFRPSIGKPGGCNPIPLAHEVAGDAIVIPVRELEKGARYFSEVVEIAVTDPVTGAVLTNTEAPYQAEYGGRTYFFESRDSYDRFRAAPQTFTAGHEARYLRVQGHRPTGG